MLDAEGKVNFLLELTPKAFCALVYDALINDRLTSEQWVDVWNARWADVQVFSSDYQHIYSMDDLDDVMDGLSPTEVLESVSHDFRTHHKFFAQNLSTGAYESGDYPEEFDTVNGRVDMSDWKRSLRELSDAEPDSNTYLEFVNRCYASQGVLYGIALEIMLADYADADLLSRPEQVKLMDELASKQDLFVIEL